MKFLAGNKSAFFRALGVGYGFIFEEGRKLLRVFTIEQGTAYLNLLVDGNKASREEADEVIKQMSDAGVVDFFSDFVARVVSTDLGDKFVSTFTFKLNTTSPVPLPHGNVTKLSDGKVISHEVATVADGLDVVFAMLEDGSYNVLDCIWLLKQIVELGLPIDRAAELKMYLELPSDKVAAIMAKLGVEGEPVHVLPVHVPNFNTGLVVLTCGGEEVARDPKPAAAPTSEAPPASGEGAVAL